MPCAEPAPRCHWPILPSLSCSRADWAERGQAPPRGRRQIAPGAATAPLPRCLCGPAEAAAELGDGLSAESRAHGSHLCATHTNRDEPALLRHRLLPRPRREGDRGQPLPQRPQPCGNTGRPRHNQPARAPCRPLGPQRAPSPRTTERGSHLRWGRLRAPPLLHRCFPVSPF